MSARGVFILATPILVIEHLLPFIEGVEMFWDQNWSDHCVIAPQADTWDE